MNIYTGQLDKIMKNLHLLLDGIICSLRRDEKRHFDVIRRCLHFMLSVKN